MRKESQLSRREPGLMRAPHFFSPWASDFWEPTRLFDEVFGGANSESFLAPAIDVEETDIEYLISADLPGMKKEDITIECADNQLTLVAERKQDETKKGRRERFYGTYQRSFTLPAGADANKIKADYEGGVLVVHIPKGEKLKAKRIQIGV